MKRRKQALPFDAEPTQGVSKTTGFEYKQWECGDYRIMKFRWWGFLCYVFEADQDEESCSMGGYRQIGEERGLAGAIERCREHHARKAVTA